MLLHEQNGFQLLCYFIFLLKFHCSCWFSPKGTASLAQMFLGFSITLCMSTGVSLAKVCHTESSESAPPTHSKCVNGMDPSCPLKPWWGCFDTNYIWLELQSCNINMRSRRRILYPEKSSRVQGNLEKAWTFNKHDPNPRLGTLPKCELPTHGLFTASLLKLWRA